MGVFGGIVGIERAGTLAWNDRYKKMHHQVLDYNYEINKSFKTKYLYSEVDYLCLSHDIHKFYMESAKRYGKDNVAYRNFVDSEHCAHILKYPEEYRSELQKLIESL